MLTEGLLSLLLLASPGAPQPNRPFNNVVRSHIKEMLARGYAQSLSWDDLNHGHILVERGKNGCYASLDELLSHVKLILYHTAERNCRWYNDPRPPRERTPRSLVGYMNGTLLPAINIVDKKDYENSPRYTVYGTIGVGDVAEKFKSLHNGLDPNETICISGKSGSWNLDFEFSIDENGNVVFGQVLQ